MVKRFSRKAVDVSKYPDYQKVAESFKGGAEVARDFEYWNAAGVLIVHSAIAYADSICIKYGGFKSQGDDHRLAVELLRGILPVSADNSKAFNNIEKIIAHKNAVSYSGEVYDRKDIENLWKNFERFKSWAEIQLSS